MGRSPCCSKEGLNRGAWNALEDRILIDYIKAHGEGGWRNLPKSAGLKRCGKSCRLRWLNYLRPGIKRGNISSDEEELIIRLHKLLGNRWSLIAGRLPGRTDNEIKNYWNTNLCKKYKMPPIATAVATTTDNAVNDNATAVATKQQPPVTKSHHVVWTTKATRCTKAVLDVPRDELGITAPVRDNTIPALDDNINNNNNNNNNNLSNLAMDLSSVEEVVSLTDFLDCSNFSSMCRDFNHNNSNDNVQDYVGSSPPSICSDDVPGIMLSEQDIEMMEDWIVSADSNNLLNSGGNNIY